MTPDIDTRLASVIRALSEVILPHLPAEAALAQEQAYLAIGHLRIIRAQIDEAPAFEAAELADARALAAALDAELADEPLLGPALGQARVRLREAAAADGAVRACHRGVNEAIAACVGAASEGDSAGVRARLAATILAHEQRRVDKDRAWFAPFGFDTH